MKDNHIKYQLIVVLAPKVDEKDQGKLFAKLESLLETQKAEISKKDNLGTKELVYPIAKQNKGDFWDFSIESTKPVEFDEINLFLNRDSKVLRYLVIKK